MNVAVRSFIEEDWTSVSKIYSDGIATGLATFETDVPSWEIWNKKFLQKCRLVAVDHTGYVIGFAMLSEVSKREVYKGVAEVTVYVAENSRGIGIGEILLKALIEKSEAQGFWTLQAGIFLDNKSSIALHEKCGFRIVGTREKIGQLHGKWHDNVLLERRSKSVMDI